jgi:two-component system sporulation sensor kinase A
MNSLIFILVFFMASFRGVDLETALIIASIGFLGSVGLSLFVGEKVTTALRQLQAELEFSFWGGKPKDPTRHPILPMEVVPILVVAVEQAQIQQRHLLEREIEQASEIRRLTAQVAHDIRSPLSALKVVSGTLSSESETIRNLLKGAISRTEDIAEQLLRGYKLFEATRSSSESVSLQKVSIALEDVFSEKSLIWKGEDIQFTREINQNCQGKLRLKFSDLQRVVSNLLDNAFQSLGNVRQISLRSWADEDAFYLTVSDTGWGFSENVLEKAGHCRITTKAEGHGLGLWGASNIISSWGGRLEIVSTVGRGSQVSVCIPLERVPSGSVSPTQQPPT